MLKPNKSEYITIKEPFTFEIDKIKGSRFIGSIFPITKKEDIDFYIEEIRKKYYDARHHCFAWQLEIDNKSEFRYNDDGEPSGTGGKPIYNHLLGSKITNCLIIVTRYFGGTKLGTGGLIKAYGETAKIILEKAKIIIIEKEKQLSFHYNYDYTNLVMNILNEYECKKIYEEYGDNAMLTIKLNESYLQSFISELKDRSNGKIRKIKIND